MIKHQFVYNNECEMILFRYRGHSNRFRMRYDIFYCFAVCPPFLTTHFFPILILTIRLQFQMLLSEWQDCNEIN